MASRSSVHRRIEKKEKLMKHANLLLHAKTCNSKENGYCTTASCYEAKCRLSHLNACRKEACTYRHCSIYKKILAHWRDCSRQDCFLCQEFRRVLSLDNDGSMTKETQASKSNTEPWLPMTVHLPENPILLQWEKMYKAVTNVEMTNRKFLAQLNHNKRKERENAEFMQGLKQSLHQLCEHMKEKNDDLSKLTKNVSKLQGQMDQIICLIRTRYDIKQARPKTSQSVSSVDKYEGSHTDGHASETNRYHGDDGEDGFVEDSASALTKVSSLGGQVLHNYELYEDRVPAHEKEYDGVGFVYQDQPLADPVLSCDDAIIHVGDVTNESQSEQDKRRFDNKEALQIGSLLSYVNDLREPRPTSSSDRNISSDNTVLSTVSSLKTAKEQLNVHKDESVQLPSEQINDSPVRNSKTSGAHKSREVNLDSDASMQYKLPPPQSTRSRDQTKKDRRILKDSRGFKRKCTSKSVDNRYKEFEKMYSNIPGARSKDKKGNKSDYQSPTSSSEQNIIKAEAMYKIVKQSAPPVRHEGVRQNGFLNTVPDIGGIHVDIDTWIDLANAEVKSGQYSQLPLGRGPDTVLCLDISESMMGGNFKEMMSVARTFIQGISTIASMKGIEENVGISVFGHETRVKCHLTNDYQRLLSDLDRLTTGGNTPLAGGLLMAMAGCSGSGRIPIINKVPAHARIILLSDGKATDNEHIPSDFQFSSLLIKDDISNTCKYLRERRHRVIWVPIGKDASSVFTDLITSITKGKTINATQQSEMKRLVEWTQTHFRAIDIASQYSKEESLEPSALHMLCAGQGITCNVDDLKDLITVCHESMYEEESEASCHEECDPYMPILGTRVKRGSTWSRGNQDTGGFGTVIGHLKNGMLNVEWDNGTRNIYNYNRNAKDVEVTDAPRILQSNELIATGCLVKRGQSWRSDNEDGGPGCVGSVFVVDRHGMVGVRWRKGELGMYRYGYDGHFDIQICNPSNPDEKDIENQATERTDTNQMSSRMNMLREEHVNKTPSIEEMNRKNTRKNTECKAKWQYIKDGGIWTNFSVEQNDKLEKAYQRNKKGSPIAEVEGEIFQVSFTKMTQTHAKSKQTMRIQRLDLHTS